MESDENWEDYTTVYEGKFALATDTVNSCEVYRYRVRGYTETCDWSDWSNIVIVHSKGEEWRRLNVQGTGSSNPLTPYIKLDDVNLFLQDFRGLHLLVLHRGNLFVEFEQTYDVFESSTASDDLSAKLDSYDSNYLLIVVSCDAWEWNFTRKLAFSFYRLGGMLIQEFGNQSPPLAKYKTVLETNHGHPYAFIGIPGFSRISGQCLESLRSNLFYYSYNHSEHNALPTAVLSTTLHFVCSRQFYFLSSSFSNRITYY